MSVVLVSSPTTNAGKTTTIVALGQRLRRMGKRVTYRRFPGAGALADAAFVATTLRLSDPRDVVAPAGDPATLAAAVFDADADVAFVEVGEEATGREAARVAFARANVVPLIVARYRAEGLTEEIVGHARELGLTRGQVIVAVVPEKGLRQIQQRVRPALAAQGLTLVAAIPQDRPLLGLSVGELATALEATVLCAHDQLGQPVEGVMISAMSDEGAEEYFRRISRKAVVAAGDRPDIHMPALATDTSCLVLTEGYDPDPTVFKTADEQGVPLLKVGPSTVETLERISDALANARFRQSSKVARAVALYGAQIDEATLARLVDGAEQEVA